MEVRRLLEGLPLQAVVAKDDKGDVFALDNIEELARAEPKLVFILVNRRGVAIGGEQSLDRYGVDCEEYWAGFGKTDNH